MQEYSKKTNLSFLLINIVKIDGSHIFDAFIDYKTNDWNQYCLYVTPWEIMKYHDY